MSINSSTAATLLSIFPGAGHMYLGLQRHGLQQMAFFLISIGVALLLTEWNKDRAVESLLMWWPVVFVLLGLEMLAYLAVRRDQSVSASSCTAIRMWDGSGFNPARRESCKRSANTGSHPATARAYRACAKKTSSPPAWWTRRFICRSMP
ncbi:LiaF transmembrane domain-containing protein [Paenibacillus koleovorans]|uniref:LiaF transmembrane domain-containing protein n=1 Tax=Paenibacillus koleovorans TaxID=121608 RepID=UPI000FDB3221|nr:hypothetical protein [Paenibacillus koleovorans]